MRSLCLLFMVLLSNRLCFAQRELIYAKDTSSLRTEVISISHFNVPEKFSPYAGIRFYDARYLKAFTGFIQQHPKAGFRKITTARSFADELNEAVKIKKDAATTKDSIVVVLKNFWMQKQAIQESVMNCHIKALCFVKRRDTLLFRGKMDTVLKRNAVLKYEFRDLPALFIEDMLAAFPLQHRHNEKYFLQNELFKQLANVKQQPVDTIKGNGLFVSFSDFLKGRVLQTGIALSEFNDQYRLSFDKTGEAEALAGKIWGCLYNGQLYIKYGKHFSKAFAIENTFLVLGSYNINVNENKSAPPVILNMDNGKLQ